MNKPAFLPSNSELFKEYAFTITIPATSAGEAPGTQFSSSYEISGYTPISLISIGLSNAGNKMAFVSYTLDRANNRVGINYKNIATSGQTSFTCTARVLYMKTNVLS